MGGGVNTDVWNCKEPRCCAGEGLLGDAAGWDSKSLLGNELWASHGSPAWVSPAVLASWLPQCELGILVRGRESMEQEKGHQLGQSHCWVFLSEWRVKICSPMCHWAIPLLLTALSHEKEDPENQMHCGWECGTFPEKGTDSNYPSQTNLGPATELTSAGGKIIYISVT